MNAAILHSPKNNSEDYLANKTNKPVLIKNIQSSASDIEHKHKVTKIEVQTYSFVGIAG